MAVFTHDKIERHVSIYENLKSSQFCIIARAMQFLPDLPDQCPPAAHQTCALDQVYRVLDGASPTNYDFLSHAKRGKTKPATVDGCRWASLSLQAGLPAVEKLLKLPNFQTATHAAILDIPASTGAHCVKGNHIDFWQALAANLNTCVVTVKQVRNG